MSSFDDQRAQIADILRQRYFPLIPQVNANWTADQHDKNRLSRSLAALAIERLSDVSSVQAANAVIDGGDDNGIDAIQFDRADNRLWVVQSKAGAAPDVGENKKFIGGIHDLLSKRFERFNAAFERFQPDIEQALATEALKVVGCVAHRGEQLGPHCVADLNQLQSELNRFVGRFEWRDLNVAVIHGWLTVEHAVRPVDVAITLTNWYGIDGPRRAFYGVVSATELAGLYHQNGKALLEKNIRHYLGAQAVNSAIAAAVHERPGDFFYLNNGLTAICSSANPAPGATHASARFFIRGFSIVNGAQTVGSIADASTRRALSPDAKVLITIIEVGTTADPIGPQITRSRNTQNAVRGIHFAALDPQQERLRQELAVSGLTYQYRSSAEFSESDPGTITLAKAAVALACLRGDTRLIVAAKREVGQLYEGDGEFYSTIFRPTLSGVQLGRSVNIYDYATDILVASELAEAGNSRRRMFYRHSRLFVLHIFARRHRALIVKPTLELTDAERADVSRAVTELAELIYDAAEATFRDERGYLSIFRNLTDCTPLAADVMRRLTRPAAAAAPAEDARQ